MLCELAVSDIICREVMTKDMGKCVGVLRMDFNKISYQSMIRLENCLHVYESFTQRSKIYVIMETNKLDLKSSRIQNPLTQWVLNPH